MLTVGCAGTGTSYRALHYIDGELTTSKPVAGYAYEAYLRARLALDSEPPRLEEAADQISFALRYDPRDPHLWTTLGEIEARAGQPRHALDAAQHALALRPGYGPAKQLMAQLRSDRPASATTSARSAHRP